MRGEVAHIDELIDDHPCSQTAEADAHDAQSAACGRTAKGEQHDREEGDEELGELGLDRTAGGDRLCRRSG